MTTEQRIIEAQDKTIKLLQEQLSLVLRKHQLDLEQLRRVLD